MALWVLGVTDGSGEEVHLGFLLRGRLGRVRQWPRRGVLVGGRPKGVPHEGYSDVGWGKLAGVPHGNLYLLECLEHRHVIVPAQEWRPHFGGDRRVERLLRQPISRPIGSEGVTGPKSVAAPRHKVRPLLCHVRSWR